jgi:hypothetical protein
VPVHITEQGGFPEKLHPSKGSWDTPEFTVLLLLNNNFSTNVRICYNLWVLTRMCTVPNSSLDLNGQVEEIWCRRLPVSMISEDNCIFLQKLHSIIMVRMFEAYAHLQCSSWEPKMLYVMSVTSYNGYLTHNKRYTLPGVHIRLNTTPETNRLLEKS